MTETEENIIDLIAMPDADDFDFEPDKLKKTIYIPEDFKL